MIKRVYFLAAALTVATVLLTAGIISSHSTKDSNIVSAKYYGIPLFKEGFETSDSPLPLNVFFIPDKDYDGISDNDDTNSDSNVFKGTFKGMFHLENSCYTMDFSTFLGDETQYDPNLASASLVFSNTMYSNNGFSYTYPDNKTICDITELMSYHGFSDIQNIKLCTQYTDNDLTEICLGFRDIRNEEKSVRVIAVIIRGTAGYKKEWSSNFDMGNPDSWDSPHHKGFKITTDRVKAVIDDYVNNLSIPSPEPVFWVSGHSRGAAISNLLSSYLINDGHRVFSYTFASPLVTEDENAGNPKYSSIFNITGKSDVVTRIPFDKWNFSRYGETIEFSANEHGIKEDWMARTGEKAYNGLNEKLIEIMINETVKSVASDRKQYYAYSGKQIFSEKQYSTLSDTALGLCKITPKKAPFSSKTEYELEPSLGFVFQLIADYLGEYDTNINGNLLNIDKEERKASAAILKEFVNTKYAFTVVLILGSTIFNGLPSIVKDFGGIESGDEIFKDSHDTAIYMAALDNHPLLSSKTI